MNYIKISKYDTANGTGIGVVLWVSGCNCHCYGCHNPQTWSFSAGVPFTDGTMQELLEALNKPYISRITYSGGHPLDPQNVDTVTQIARTVRQQFPNKLQWLYTGYRWEDVKEFEVIRYLDVLVDGRYEETQRDITLAFCGSRNQRVIDVQESIKQDTIILYSK